LIIRFSIILMRGFIIQKLVDLIIFYKGMSLDKIYKCLRKVNKLNKKIIYVF